MSSRTADNQCAYMLLAGGLQPTDYYQQPTAKLEQPHSCSQATTKQLRHWTSLVTSAKARQASSQHRKEAKPIKPSTSQKTKHSTPENVYPQQP